MIIDFDADSTELLKMLQTSFERYSAANSADDSAADHPPVTRVDLVFWLGDGGDAAPFILLQLDTRPGSDPDGTWAFEEFAALERPAWSATIHSVCDGETANARLLDGTIVSMNAENLTQLVGEFLVSTLKLARESGLFKKLPKADRCELGVEESGGEFGWPAYDDRGIGNLA